MQAFKELVSTRSEAKKYLPDDFDPDAELEAARREKMHSIEGVLRMTDEINAQFGFERAFGKTNEMQMLIQK